MKKAVEHSDIATSNRSAILERLLLNGPLARTELAQLTSLAGASVSRATKLFLNAGLVEEKRFLDANGRRGRRVVPLNLRRRGGFFIAIGLTTRPEISIVDLYNNQLAAETLSEFHHNDPATAIDQVSICANRLINEAGIPRARILGCGVAVTGSVDAKGGVLRKSPYLGWQNVELAAILENKLNVPVFVEGLSNAFNLAETRFGIAKGHSDVLLVHASLGISASLLLDNRLIRGNDFGAGAIGGLKPADTGFGEADCHELELNNLAGGRGVMANLAGSPAERCEVWKIPAEVAWKKYEQIISRALNGDAQCCNAFGRTGFILGATIAPSVAMTHPESIILAGQAAQVAEFVTEFSTALEMSLSATFQKLPVFSSTMTRSVAAGWFAVNETIVGQGLSLQKLKQLEATPAR